MMRHICPVLLPLMYHMRRLLAIALVSFYVISFTELHHLIKFPVLLEHYIEHKELSDITFFEFLSLHYNSEAVTHDAHDKELPFKDFDHCIAVQTVVLPYIKIELREKVPSENAIVYPLFNNKFIAASHLSEIWQPPKV
jgi:hypothetical protein